jgi:serine/threonine protein kinase
MDWVYGDTLESFITNNLTKPNKLRELARKLRQLVGALNTKHIAHGDLQHGNILVTKNEELVLVDYDDFFIPQFLGETSSELGHPNYQHPLRNATFYDERIDNFSALILYLSLLGIADNSNLWQEYHDDEYLILNRHDFECPNISPCLQRLKQSRDHTISRIANYVDRFCREEPTNVPTLDNIIQGHVPEPSPPVFKISMPQINQQVMSGDALNLSWISYNIYDNIFFELAQGNINPKVLISSPIIQNKVGANSFILNLPSKLPSSNDYRIRVSLSQSKQPVIYSHFFNIIHSNKPILKLQSPKPGDIWLWKGEYPITWYFENLSGKIRIELLFADRLHRVLTEIAEPGSNNYGSFRWKVPLYDTRNRYRIKLISTIDSSINDSSNLFIICGEKFTRRFSLFQQKPCSWCSTFYQEQNLCAHDYKLVNGISCAAVVKKLTVTERDEMLRDDKWWYKISSVIEKMYGI